MASTIDLALLRKVAYSAVVSDCCDQVGLRHQTLAPGLRPIAPGLPVIVGYARPVRSVAVERAPDVPYAAEVAYVDSLAPDDVVVAVTDPVGAFWGELFSTAAVARGAVGAVIDGTVRDTGMIAAMGWPILARGTHPTDSLGRMSVVERDVPIEILGVTVARGDLVVADGDGTVIVPAASVEEVVARAIAKVTTESSARFMLQGGAYLRDAWERFKVL